MFEFLAAYLEANVTPEQKQVFMDACTTLSKNGFTDHEFVIEQDLMLADNLDSDIATSMITNYLLPVYRDRLAEFGVFASDELTLAMATDILTGLLSIDNYDDRDSINARCESYEGPEAALADILELVGARHSDEYLTVLERVSPDLIARIESMTDQVNEEDIANQDQVESIRTRLLALNVAIGGSDKAVMANEYLAEGGKIGIPAGEIVAPFRERLDEIATAGELARELLMLVALSDVRLDNLNAAVKAELDLLHLKPMLLTSVDVAVRNYIGGIRA